jgi:hypothetical protein
VNPPDFPMTSGQRALLELAKPQFACRDEEEWPAPVPRSPAGSEDGRKPAKHQQRGHHRKNFTTEDTEHTEKIQKGKGKDEHPCEPRSSPTFSLQFVFLVFCCAFRVFRGD